MLMPSTETLHSESFSELSLCEPLLETLAELGYETPSPVQAQTIPHLCAGKDLVGVAQTGTGKTAAFALPILSQIDLAQRTPQGLVLAPTRELAIQVAESFAKYAAKLPGFRALAVYGGQSYGIQLRELRQGPHVIVGTPGRVMDHLRRGTLKLDGLKTFVLDEADEMLRMGFIDDVNWILEHTPENRQTALFSATMPPPIRRIAQKHLSEPAEITIENKTRTAGTINHRFWQVRGARKGEALARILAGEAVDGMLVFVRTKSMTNEVAERLEAGGHAAAALNGDIPQAQREQTIQRLKNGRLDIVVATDVAARGLDVDRISHVVNYDLPHEAESYVHRVGRTGRAGRTGEAISFVASKQMRTLRDIEKATRQRITKMELPSPQAIDAQRIARFKQQITEAATAKDIDVYRQLIEEYQQEFDLPVLDVAAALAKLLQKEGSLRLPSTPATERRPKSEPRESRESQPQHQFRKVAAHETQHTTRREEPATTTRQPEESTETAPRPEPVERARPQESEHAPRRPETSQTARQPETKKGDRRADSNPEEGMERFCIQVGRTHGVQPGNIVGAIANEAGLSSGDIGRINIFDLYSTVDLPEGMPREIFRMLKKVRVAGQELRISRTEKPKKKPTRKREKFSGPRPGQEPPQMRNRPSRFRKGGRK